MYLARSFPLIKPASFYFLIGYIPFDASTPPKRCRMLASISLYDSGACSTIKTRRTKSLAPYCHHYHHHHSDAFAGITLRTNTSAKARPSTRCGYHHEMTTLPDQQIRSNTGIIHVTSAD